MWRYGLAVVLFCTGLLSTTVVAQPLPNLRPYQLGGWTQPLLIRTNLQALTDVSIISERDDVYVGWAVLNDSEVDIPNHLTNVFFIQVLLNGQQIDPPRRISYGLAAHLYTWIDGANIGKLPIGTHTLRLQIDSSAVIPESSEVDNFYERQITVVSTNGAPPQLQNSVVNGSRFEFSIVGAPGRYAVERSSNLQNWSTVGQATNVSGSVTVSITPSGPSAVYRTRREGN